ncbi:MAG: D-2-hydroxyacid dehydrogenase, partial [Candidatus Dormiibacterota bacterium]
MTLLVGVVEGETPSRGVLPPRPDMGYVFIDPSSEPPPEAFDVDALLIWNPRSGVLRENWKRFGRLRWVHTGTAGVERVLFPELLASDVVLTNSRYVFDEALAEYTIALMLALGKDLLTKFRYQNEHRWAPRETGTLSGKVAVMVG